MSETTTSVFDEIKNRVDLADYLSNHAGVELVSGGPGTLEALCPFHAEDTPSFKVTDARSGEPWKTWRCYGSCSTGGTVIDAVMQREGFETAFEAIELLNELYGLGLENNTKRFEKFKRTVAEATTQIEKADAEMRSGSERATRARSFLHARGYTDETIEHFGLAVHTAFSSAGRLAIPIFDRANHPISMSHRALFDRYPCASCGVEVAAKDIAGRRHKSEAARKKGLEEIDWQTCPHCEAPKDEARIAWLVRQHPKYMNEADYEKSKLLYNEPSSRRALRKDEDVIGYFIMEGYADVWACHQAGQRACSSYNGASISSWQAAEAAKLCGASDPDRPLILIPDFDQTGIPKVRTNIEEIRRADPNVEIQVVANLSTSGDSDSYKDLGELLSRRGADAVAQVLEENRISADEWLLREVLDARNPKTGKPFHSKTRQMELCSQILSGVHHRVAIDHLVPVLAGQWGIQEPQARDFVYANITGRESLPAEHLMKDVHQAQAEAIAYLRDDFVIPHGFESLDRCFPGGGARIAQLSLWLGKSGVGKTALMLQVLANMARRGVRCIFFSLEQPAAQLFMRMTCQVLAIPMDEAIELIKNEDPRLAEVRETFERLVIIDNVPGEGQTEMVDMSAGRIHKIIHDVNLTRFPEPAQVVAVDHLGILKVGSDAPRNVQNDELQAAGYIMQELFSVCKATKTYFMVLQQLPKDVKQGEPIMSGDMGRGGAKQQDFADYVMGIWRPEQRADLDDEERIALEGQYKLYPAKNRHGAQQLCHLYFDRKNLRIMEALDMMPSHSAVGSLDSADGAPVRIGSGDGEDDFLAIEQAQLERAQNPPSDDPPPERAQSAPAAAASPQIDLRVSPPPPLPVADPNQSDPHVPLDSDAILGLLGVADDSEHALEEEFFE
ncbi:DnaB-like helicase C-terminal domain-containing protein [Miltoncostaea oceani]|uniref:DnaB-like helicase C-terminal domain-containing protein n=1 Tax=Miltoncostaea oceani TaxID=2843216 RepID=UPI001C3D6149|nr:DnaB-like helicase C-terminal domain-containing protein [Miltoncostaea oceani]